MLQSRWLVLASLLVLGLVACGEETLKALPEEPEIIPQAEALSPIAVCAVSPALVHPPFESATWQGSGSSDPNGGGIARYLWQIQEKPDGSAAVMPDCGNDPDCGPFTPDLAGIYVGLLTVTNTAGKTASCTVELEAEPTENLWIEMYWTHDGDDMDLHLLAPGGEPRTEKDCYFANCVGSGPDWGQLGDADDDPALDLDDISGVGPENINITAPANGTYTVFVHDYPGSEYAGSNAVTVKVRVDGNLVFNETRSISGEDADVYFCEISWPSGVVTSL